MKNNDPKTLKWADGKKMMYCALYVPHQNTQTIKMSTKTLFKLKWKSFLTVHSCVPLANQQMASGPQDKKQCKQSGKIDGVQRETNSINRYCMVP